CRKKGERFCTTCNLVKYCSKECQDAHWDSHQKDCKSEITLVTWLPECMKDDEVEKRQQKAEAQANSKRKITGAIEYHLGSTGLPKRGDKPCYHKYLIGNTPAYDIVNLSEVEGLDWKHDLDILFAASGDLRNVMKTVVSLPDSYRNRCNVHVNDRDEYVVFRAIMILLLVLLYPDGNASELVLHLWYSGRLPQSMYKRGITDWLIPKLSEAFAKSLNEKAPPDKVFAHSFTNGTSTVTVRLTSRMWLNMLVVLERPKETELGEEVRLECMLTAEPEKPWVQYNMHMKDPAYRLGELRYRTTGLLLPFGARDEHFDTMNPTFFDLHWNYLVAIEPLPGASLNDLKRCRTTLGLPECDVYGAFFYHQRDLIEKFDNSLSDRPVNIVLYNQDAIELAGQTKTQMSDRGSEGQFDRIDLSNALDSAYIGTKQALKTFIPLLKAKKVNPSATLL
ncbi:uncharacterized protein LY89DRAFT_558780, partial [Mollisia scopiformis]